MPLFLQLHIKVSALHEVGVRDAVGIERLAAKRHSVDIELLAGSAVGGDCYVTIGIILRIEVQSNLREHRRCERI